MVVSFPVADIQSADEERHRRQLAEVVNSVRNGKLNSAIDFSLRTTPNETTTVSNPNIAATSRILLIGENAAAAADLASGSVRIDDASITNGNFTVQHTRFANARLFRAVILS